MCLRESKSSTAIWHCNLVWPVILHNSTAAYNLIYCVLCFSFSNLSSMSSFQSWCIKQKINWNWCADCCSLWYTLHCINHGFWPDPKSPSHWHLVSIKCKNWFYEGRSFGSYKQQLGPRSFLWFQMARVVFWLWLVEL
jgi:hypothetical protein